MLIGRGAQWIDGTRVAERRNLADSEKTRPADSSRHDRGRKGASGLARQRDPAARRERRCAKKCGYSSIGRGAADFVVSFLWGFLNPVHERRVKEIIRDEYKEFHIGYLPVVLAGQVVGKLGEYERTMAAILDAYLQRSMQIELSAMWDKLRETRLSKSHC